MNISDIEKIFEKMRKAGHGSLIRFDAAGKGQAVEGIIFEPSDGRPPGFESGIFVNVPSDTGATYYFDFEASKQQGRIVVQKLDMKKTEPEPVVPEEFLKEFEHVRQAPDVKIGGGAVGELYSKYKGLIELNK
ncbi:MAG: hypothetical protein C4520_05460 [Candidatus Abyssobacteria bacterium SURF_5]|uniref:Uncharacterized protein n=1 Tax=Abyssobacteria bacterium (strain SURF_5) TaxID=2093360 RepID=A0A3A4NYF1_ABYX5|nr:MAG: hypothetical protein C4520_05460 [Candidatus Abyssubacteria bacterium SURF_5]